MITPDAGRLMREPRGSEAHLTRPAAVSVCRSAATSSAAAASPSATVSSWIGLVDVEGQIVRAELGQMAGFPQAVDRKRQRLSGDDHEADAGRCVAGQSLDKPYRRRGRGEQVESVEDYDGRLGAGMCVKTVSQEAGKRVGTVALVVLAGGDRLEFVRVGAAVASGLVERLDEIGQEQAERSASSGLSGSTRPVLRGPAAERCRLTCARARDQCRRAIAHGSVPPKCRPGPRTTWAGPARLPARSLTRQMLKWRPRRPVRPEPRRERLVRPVRAAEHELRLLDVVEVALGVDDHDLTGLAAR